MRTPRTQEVPLATPSPQPPTSTTSLKEKFLATLQVGDVLHASAFQDVPSANPAAQASWELARKYGIMRNGQHMRYSSTEATWLPTVAPPEPAPAPAKEEEKEPVPPSPVDDPTIYDIARARDMLWEDLLNNPEQQRLIESRLDKIDENQVLRDMLTGRRFQQRVRIRPGVFEPVYEQLPFWTEHRLQERMVELVGLQKATNLHAQERYALWGLVCSLVRINDTPLHSVYQEDGSQKLDWAKFDAKEKQILNLPSELVVSLSVHYNFFSLRMRRLLTVQSLGNG